MYLSILKRALGVGVLLFIAGVAVANEPVSDADPVLTVSYQGKSHAFSMAALQAMPSETVATETPWTDGMRSYRGVPLAHLLKTVQAKNVQSMKVTALNDYHAVVDYPAIQKYPVILAYEADGKVMRVRDKGPLWLLYPLSDYEALRVPKRHSEMVWQVRTIEIE